MEKFLIKSHSLPLSLSLGWRLAGRARRPYVFTLLLVSGRAVARQAQTLWSIQEDVLQTAHLAHEAHQMIAAGVLCLF